MSNKIAVVERKIWIFLTHFFNNQWTEFGMTEACRLKPSRATAVLCSKFVEFNSVNWDQHGSSETFESPGPVEGFFFARNEGKAKVMASEEKEEVELWFKWVWIYLHDVCLQSTDFYHQLKKRRCTRTTKMTLAVWYQKTSLWWR